MKATTKKYIYDLVNAGLIGESKMVQLAAISLARNLKGEDLEFSKKINKAISSFSIAGGSSIRSAERAPIPLDNETQLEMATSYKPDVEKNVCPILPKVLKDRIGGFLEERNSIDTLLDSNIFPSTSLLLIGQPGTGKTMLARHIASSLSKELIILDLSSSMSSLMGKTGANLKKVLQYAKRNASVLLFDEFDAIAKKRDDNTDLGEIKRVVNVLLMELEDWPVSSVFLAASNHPELLDKAIWRRFDHVLKLPLPEEEERRVILKNELAEFLQVTAETSSILDPIAELFQGRSPADICRYANNVKRRCVLRHEEPIKALLGEIDGFSEDKKLRARFCIVAKEILGERITVRELAEMTGLTTSGVQHHLSKSKL